MNQISEVEETIKRLSDRRGVKGVIVTTTDGVVIKSTLTGEASTPFAQKMTPIISQCQQLIKSYESTEMLKFLSLRSDQLEFLIYPDSQYVLIVIQQVNH